MEAAQLGDQLACFQTQMPQDCFPAFTIFFVDVAEVYTRNCLEESGQFLENVDPTHLVLASGKRVLQNNTKTTKD